MGLNTLLIEDSGHGRQQAPADDARDACVGGAGTAREGGLRAQSTGGWSAIKTAFLARATSIRIHDASRTGGFRCGSRSIGRRIWGDAARVGPSIGRGLDPARSRIGQRPVAGITA
jgi:hypothetical protein